MKRCISMVGMLLLSFMLLLSSCGPKEPASTTAGSTETKASVYYINGNSSELIEEDISIPDTSRSGQLKFLIEQLISPPAGKVSPLPEGTKLNSVTIQNDIAVVDFSKEFADGDSLKQTLAPVAVAQTLCTLEYIAGVQILVNSEEATGSDGKPLGVIRETDLIINGGNQPSAAPKTTVLLYFGDEMAEYLVPERRNIDIAAGDTVEKIIVEELMKGPSEVGNIRTIPQEAKLLSIETKDSVCFVNFSKDFVDKHSGGTTGEKLTVFSVVNSLTELGTIDRVQFLIEGEKREEFIEMVFNEPIVRNSSMIKQ